MFNLNPTRKVKLFEWLNITKIQRYITMVKWKPIESQLELLQCAVAACWILSAFQSRVQLLRA